MVNGGLGAWVKEGCWGVKSQVKGHSAREPAAEGTEVAEGTEGTEKTEVVEGTEGEVLYELRNNSRLISKNRVDFSLETCGTMRFVQKSEQLSQGCD